MIFVYLEKKEDSITNMKMQYVLSTKGDIYHVKDRDIYLDGNQYYATLNNKRTVEICMIRDGIDSIMLANQHYLIEKRKMEKSEISD